MTKAKSNHAAVESLLVSLRQEKALDTHDEALGRLALTLADALDDGAGMATAAVSKELRATLAAESVTTPCSVTRSRRMPSAFIGGRFRSSVPGARGRRGVLWRVRVAA